MGEYIKYKGREVKIGTMANLYYVTFPKYLKAFCTRSLKRAPDNLSPETYLQPDSENYFRFPFPDEDKLPFGETKGDYLRTVSITVDAKLLPDFGIEPGKRSSIEIIQQQLVHAKETGELTLALVYHDSERRNFLRMDKRELALKLVQQIVRHHILPAPNMEHKVFYRLIACRILKGYRLGIDVKKQLQKAQDKKVTTKRKGLGN